MQNLSHRNASVSHTPYAASVKELIQCLDQTLPGGAQSQNQELFHLYMNPPDPGLMVCWKIMSFRIFSCTNKIPRKTVLINFE